LADACVFLVQHYNKPDIINVGCGEDISIAALANLVKEIVGFKGYIRYDTSRPDGTPRKLMDVGRLSSLGWQARIVLSEGIEDTYQWFLTSLSESRKV
jgi:GDP-L-fucose synthase